MVKHGAMVENILKNNLILLVYIKQIIGGNMRMNLDEDLAYLIYSIVSEIPVGYVTTY